MRLLSSFSLPKGDHNRIMCRNFSAVRDFPLRVYVSNLCAVHFVFSIHRRKNRTGVAGRGPNCFFLSGKYLTRFWVGNNEIFRENISEVPRHIPPPLKKIHFGGLRPLAQWGMGGTSPGERMWFSTLAPISLYFCLGVGI